MVGSGEAALFWVAGTLMVIGGLGLIFARKAVHAALSMVLIMALLGVVYLAQGADFLGIIQIFVYTGAVMMLFIFVVMIVGVDSSDTFVDTLRGHRWISVLVALGLGGLLISAIRAATVPDTLPAMAGTDGNISGIAGVIFGPYVWVFEVTSALLITAALAAMTLAHRERLLPRPSQHDWSRRRFRDNRFVAGLPAPGVYARHNAVDTPALLPDGSPSELSVSRVLSARDQVRGSAQWTEGVEAIERDIEEGSAT